MEGRDTTIDTEKQYFINNNNSNILVKLECNIGSRGKFLRLISGSFGVLVGIVAASFLYVQGIDVGAMWLVPASLIGGGSFAIFEGWSGWCVARALGFWTPI